MKLPSHFGHGVLPAPKKQQEEHNAQETDFFSLASSTESLLGMWVSAYEVSKEQKPMTGPLRVDLASFLLTFAADRDYHANIEGQETYLDRSSGALIYTVTDPSIVAALIGEAAIADFLDNTALVKANPDRYLLIPSMSHGEHHAVIQAFLDSDWTSDQQRRDHASGVYFPRKSLGYWVKNVGDEATLQAHDAFRSARHQQLAEDFLRKNGISNFEWV